MTTSEPQSVYVFARLGRISHPVGRYQFEQGDTGRPTASFQYSGSWLRGEGGVSFPLDPVNLPLQSGPYRDPQRGGLFGPLADATPDAWGRRIIGAERKTPPASPVEWLLATGNDRVGCLRFSTSRGAPPDKQDYVGVSNLEELAADFEALQRGEETDPKFALLYRAGKSLGGARPKAVVEYENSLWIAKFQKPDDEFDQCMAEHAAMSLARDCGIDTCDTRIVPVGPRRAVLIRRFDRSSGPSYEPTVHFLSALSLLNLSETATQGSYSEIAQEILKYGAEPHADRRELFRRMVFNVACGNRDDHLKNHALLHSAEGWRLSPAFDILPQPDFYPNQAISIGRSGTYPSRSKCLSEALDFVPTKGEAEEILNGVAETLIDWRDRFKSYGADDVTIRRVAPAFSDLREPAVTPAP